MSFKKQDVICTEYSRGGWIHTAPLHPKRVNYRNSGGEQRMALVEALPREKD